MFNLKEIVIGFVVVGILVGFGLLILTEVQTEINSQTGGTSNSSAYNGTGEAIDAIGDLAGWLPLLALVIIAAIIIGYLMVSFGGRAGGA